jgi:uncharacterized protein YutE (UPF0331/DUF86 family)
MDKDIIATKIETIRRCIKRIKEHTPGCHEDLIEDYDFQDIISLNLERAIQASVDIAAHLIADTEETPAQTMSESFIQLSKCKTITKALSERMKKSVGFRNISVHEYQSVDWRIVYSLCTQHLGDFTEYIKQLTNYCKMK